MAEYFDKKEATVPCLVCRAWSDIFIRRIWHSVDVDLWHTGKGLTLEYLTRNAHHVRSLAFHNFDVPGYFLVPSTRLISLRFHATNNSDQTEKWRPFAQLIRNNPNLQQLRISDLSGTSTLEVWQALSSCPDLRVVHVMINKMDHDKTHAFWEGCRGIQELGVSVVYPQDMATFYNLAPDILPNLHTLELDTSRQTSSTDHIVLLTKTPNLRTLLWHGGRQTMKVPATALIKVLQEGCLPLLETLELSRLVEDTDMASCLKGMNHVRSFSAEQSLFNNLAFNQLVPHFSTLQTLNLFRSLHFTGDMIQTVLESCPALEVIKAGTVRASRIMAGDPWACSRLTLFQICVLVDPGEEMVRTQSRQVFARLAKLTQLVKLDLTANGRDIQSLDFQVESGVEQLASLRRLRLICFPGTIQSLSAQEVQEIRESWKQKFV